MKIGPSYVPSFLITIKEQILDKFTAKQKLIGVIALAALASLPFLLKRAYSYYKAQKFELLLNEAVSRRGLSSTPAATEARFQAAFAYGSNAELVYQYSDFLIGQEKWAEAEQQLIKLLEPGIVLSGQQLLLAKKHYSDALIAQEKFEESALFLERVRLEAPQDFYSDSGLCKKYAYTLLYGQNNAEKAHAILVEADRHFPRETLLIYARTEVLIQLNSPYEEIIAPIQQVLPDLMGESEDYSSHHKIQLLSKYIEVQLKNGRPAQEQSVKLREILNAANEPQSAFEYAWQGVGQRVLGNLIASKRLLQEALSRKPADRLTRKEYQIAFEAAKPFELIAEAKVLSTRRNIVEADAKFKEALSFGKNPVFIRDYARFLLDHQKWDEAEIQLKEYMVLEPNGRLQGEKPEILLLRTLLQQGKINEISLFLAARLSKRQEEFYRDEDLCPLYGSILLFQGEVEKANEIFSKITAPSSVQPFLIHQMEALTLLGKTGNEILSILNGLSADLLNNGPYSYLKAAILAKYIEVQRLFGLPDDKALAKLGEIMRGLDEETGFWEMTDDPIQGECVDDIWRAMSLRILGRRNEAKKALEEVLRDNPHHIFARREYDLLGA